MVWFGFECVTSAYVGCLTDENNRERSIWTHRSLSIAFSLSTFQTTNRSHCSRFFFLYSTTNKTKIFHNFVQRSFGIYLQWKQKNDKRFTCLWKMYARFSFIGIGIGICNCNFSLHRTIVRQRFLHFFFLLLRCKCIFRFFFHRNQSVAFAVNIRCGWMDRSKDANKF